MNICIFGDSIAWGEHDCEKGGWAERLRTCLMGDDISIYNLSIDGDIISELLKRFEAEAALREPDVIIFAIGVNDTITIGDRRVSNPKEFEENIETLTDKARRFADKIVFIGFTEVDEIKTSPIAWSSIGETYDNQGIKDYNWIIKSFCNKKGLTFIDMLDVVSKDDLYDGVHPNVDGHEKMFEKIRTALAPVIKQ